MPIQLTKPTDTNMDAYHRVLRLVTAVSWLALFPLALVHGILSHNLFPVLGIIPMTFSSLFGAIKVRGWLNASATTFLDIFFSASVLAFLIPSWIVNTAGCYGWRWNCRNPSFAMVAAYATVPMMLNFGIHLYFALREIRNGFFTKIFEDKRCPHCNEYLSVNQRPHSPASSSSKESYQPVNMIDDENAAGPASYNDHDANQPRPSTDDETARLV